MRPTSPGKVHRHSCKSSAAAPPCAPALPARVASGEALPGWVRSLRAALPAWLGMKPAGIENRKCFGVSVICCPDSAGGQAGGLTVWRMLRQVCTYA